MKNLQEAKENLKKIKILLSDQADMIKEDLVEALLDEQYPMTKNAVSDAEINKMKDKARKGFKKKINWIYDELTNLFDDYEKKFKTSDTYPLKRFLAKFLEIDMAL